MESPEKMKEQQLAKKKVLKVRLENISKEAKGMGLSIGSLINEIDGAKAKAGESPKIKRYIDIYFITFPISFLIFFKHIAYDKYFGSNFTEYLIGTLFLSLTFNYLLSLTFCCFITRFLQMRVRVRVVLLILSIIAVLIGLLFYIHVSSYTSTITFTTQ